MENYDLALHAALGLYFLDCCLWLVIYFVPCLITEKNGKLERRKWKFILS